MMRTIGEIADIRTGYHLRARIEPGRESPYRIIQMKDLDSGGNLSSLSLTPFSIPGNPERYLLKTGDVLFLSRGQRNFAVHIGELLKNAIAGSIFYILRVRDGGVMPAYLSWYINQPAAQAVIKDMAQGSQIPMIPKSSFANLSIEIPPLEIQRVVVELNRLARHEREILQRLSEKRHALIQACCHMKIKETLQ